MRAKSANPNDCAAPFLSPAVVNLRWYYYIILQILPSFSKKQRRPIFKQNGEGYATKI